MLKTQGVIKAHNALWCGKANIISESVSPFIINIDLIPLKPETYWDPTPLAFQ